MILISPTQLKVVNLMLTERAEYKEKVDLLTTQVNNLENLMTIKDSINNIKLEQYDIRYKKEKRLVTTYKGVSIISSILLIISLII